MPTRKAATAATADLLDDHLLRDIGISREAAKAEAEAKGWDAPDHWHQ